MSKVRCVFERRILQRGQILREIKTHVFVFKKTYLNLKDFHFQSHMRLKMKNHPYLAYNLVTFATTNHQVCSNFRIRLKIYAINWHFSHFQAHVRLKMKKTTK